eukprot:TRINITY_DN25372_c0_g1_i1.p1 TRINITY_DN25372_c0_g1~~TRINITY_DN25372_c0_g1_i1.p1  ORF type:complete len:147 (+),score=21.88 TRINITY_DN25372_c0_g1_i1:170-610(+)
MPSGFGWRLRVVLVPLKFVAMMSNFVAILMCYDAIEKNVIASLRPGYRMAIYNETMTSAKVAVGLALLCCLLCLLSLMVGYSTLHGEAAIFQIPLHIASAALYFTVHYEQLHFMRFWHLLFTLVLPAALLEISLVAAVRNAKKISW